jgi:hypothetical protein
MNISLPGLQAQLRENFDDHDLAYNPSWVGDTSNWSITPECKLRSNVQVSNAIFYMSTTNGLVDSAQWDFHVSINFNPSSLNYIDVFLVSSDSALAAVGTKGYFVRIGNTEDDICLYRKDSGSSTRLIDGLNGILNSSASDISIRVVHKNSGIWELWRKLSNGTGYLYREGSVFDTAYHQSDYFGLLIKQSTSGFFNKHLFDDISVTPFIPDSSAPSLLSLIVTGDSTLDVQFSEQLATDSISVTRNYYVDQGIGEPLSARLDSINPALIHLVFATAFPLRTSLHISLSGIADLNGNDLVPVTASFARYAPASYDLVIDEIMADPVPSVGLPDAEWIEIRNRSGMAVNLDGWRIRSNDQLSGPLPERTLLPDSFIVITSTGSLPLFSRFPNCVSVTSFPYLTNDGNIIELISSSGLTIHSVHYEMGWYRNAVKQEGGWSLEMIDINTPCGGEMNWIACIDPSGGTPGRINSNDGINPDRSPPLLIAGIGLDSLNIMLNFSEALDSSSAAATDHYRIGNANVSILSADPLPPLFDKVLLTTSGMQPHMSYELYATGIRDCAGLTIPQQIFVGRKESPDSMAIVINEILFDPQTGGYDYVELWNHSASFFDLSDLYLAHRNEWGNITDVVRLAESERPFSPGQLIVITEDSNSVKRDYTVMNPNMLIQVGSLPSFPDDTGHIILLNAYGSIIDEVAYSDNWHFPLITNPQGVALERISPELSSNDPGNWHSASTDAGYGTPTAKNSQYRPVIISSDQIRVEPQVISPDNDGSNDFTCIYYSLDGPGNMLNITVFDMSGRPVRYLEQGAIAGREGMFRWDGLDAKGDEVLAGLYVILTEVINESGKISRIKKTVSVFYGK